MRFLWAVSDPHESQPAIKLFSWLQSVANASAWGLGGFKKLTWDTALLEKFSPTMRDLPPVSDADIHLWVKYWKAKGFVRTTNVEPIATMPRL